MTNLGKLLVGFLTLLIIISLWVSFNTRTPDRANPQGQPTVSRTAPQNTGDEAGASARTSGTSVSFGNPPATSH